MSVNYVLISEITTSVSAASVTFSNVPTTGYTDLKIVLSARSTANGGQNVNLTFNSTASGYSDIILSGNGTAASSFSSGNTTRGGSCAIPGADFTANTFGNGEIYIPSYNVSGIAKSFMSDSVTENNTSLSYIQMQATMWTGTGAVSTILIDLSGGSFVAGSTFSLYGIATKNVTPTVLPKASGGDIITNDGTYWIHTFLSSGVFIPQANLNCDYLVVAGGGGGGATESGNGGAGGGGAGGYRTGTGFSLSSNAIYPITVGAGGTGSLSRVGAGTSGSASVFSSISSAGGGYGASAGAIAPASGGSGGGGTVDSRPGGAGNTPSVSPSQGNNGGTNLPNFPFTGAGGGGASAVGGSGGSTGTGAGGAGTANSISGTSVTYAGGGGGGAGNNGSGASSGGAGGGGGGGTGTASAATVNTGGGGGGGGGGTTPAYGGNGGSGIVIVRYTMA